MLKKIIVISVIIYSGLFSCVYVYALDKEDDEFYKAVEVYSKGLYKDSTAMFGNFIDTYPDSLKLYMAKLYLAKSLYFRGDYLKTISLIDGVIASKKARNVYDEAYYWLAKTYYILGNYNSAFEYASVVVKNYPDSYFLWDVKYLISQIYLRKNNVTLAITTLKEIINNASDGEILDNAYLEVMELYYKEKDYKDLDLVAYGYLKNRPGGRFKDRAYFYRAESYYYKDSYDKAIKWYSKALDISVDNRLKDSIYQNRGMSFLAEGKLDKAKLDFSKIQSKEYRLFSEGMYYFNMGDYPLSLNKLNNFMELFPDSKLYALAFLHKAGLLYRMGRLKDALYLYRKIIDSTKVSSNKKIIDDAYYGLGWCYIKSGDFNKAIKAFKNTIRSTDDIVIKISSQMQIADSYKETGDLDKSLAQYKKVLDEYPDNMYADYIYFQIGTIMLKKKKPDMARVNFLAIVDKFPSSRLLPEAIYYIGTSYMLEEKFNRAGIEFSRFIRNYPHHALASRACYLYSKCLIASKDYQDALSYLNEVIGSTDDKELKELACIGRIQLYYQLYYFNKAREEARRFFRLFPESKMAAFVYLYMGKIFQAQSDYSKAEHFYQIVIDNYNSTDAAREARFSLGVLYFSNNDLGKARRYFSGLAKSNDALSKEAQLYIAEIFVNENKEEKALAIYRNIIKSNDQIPRHTLFRYASLLKDMKKYKEAEVVFKELIKEDAGSSRVRFMLGFCLERLNKPKEAIEEYSKVVYNSNITDDKVKAYFRMARIYERQNNTAKAKDIYRKIIATGSPEAKIAAGRLKELNAH